MYNDALQRQLQWKLEGREACVEGLHAPLLPTKWVEPVCTVPELEGEDGPDGGMEMRTSTSPLTTRAPSPRAPSCCQEDTLMRRGELLRRVSQSTRVVFEVSHDPSFCFVSFWQDAPVDECVLTSMRWGLVPAWFKEDDPSKMQYSTSNCRSENMLSKKSYKVHAVRRRRQDGFVLIAIAPGQRVLTFCRFPEGPDD